MESIKVAIQLHWFLWPPRYVKLVYSSLTSALTARFDILMTMFALEKINEDPVNCPRFVGFDGALCEDSFSSFNQGQLTKRLHGESDEFDEEEALQAQR